MMSVLFFGRISFCNGKEENAVPFCYSMERCYFINPFAVNSRHSMLLWVANPFLFNCHIIISLRSYEK